MSLIIRSDFNGVTDPDAGAYIAAVENADAQPLEFAVGKAINDFVVGCKADGIWNAIKASCILAGARTLSGALVPLVGAAPTNNNFVSGDYNRKTGLNSSTGFLNSNRASTDDPLNNIHAAIYMPNKAPTNVSFKPFTQTTGTTSTEILVYNPDSLYVYCRNGSDTLTGSYSSRLNFLGVSRNSASNFNHRTAGSTIQVNLASSGTGSGNFRLATGSTGRLAFYSIGTFLDLALLDTRVTALINAFGAAIP